MRNLGGPTSGFDGFEFRSTTCSGCFHKGIPCRCHKDTHIFYEGSLSDLEARVFAHVGTDEEWEHLAAELAVMPRGPEREALKRRAFGMLYGARGSTLERLTVEVPRGALKGYWPAVPPAREPWYVHALGYIWTRALALKRRLGL